MTWYNCVESNNVSFKPCSHVTFASASASNVKNEFYDSRWWCSHLTSTFLRMQRQRSKENANANADIMCDRSFTLSIWTIREGLFSVVTVCSRLGGGGGGPLSLDGLGPEPPPTCSNLKTQRWNPGWKPRHPTPHPPTPVCKRTGGMPPTDGFLIGKAFKISTSYRCNIEWYFILMCCLFCNVVNSDKTYSHETMRLHTGVLVTRLQVGNKKTQDRYVES